MSLIDKLADKVSEFSANISDRVGEQLTTLKQQGIKFPTLASFFKDSNVPSTALTQNNLILNRIATNVAVTQVPGMPIEMSQTTNDADRVFKTIGGEWRQIGDDSPHFYRAGENTAGTTLFDQEYYHPSPEQYEMAREGYWIKLSATGGLRDVPENKDKPKPENISDFEWKGFAWCHPDNVPADYKTEGRSVTFENEAAAQNPVNALKRYVVENHLTDGVQWDEAKARQAFENVIADGGRIELEKVGEEGGKSVYNVKMDGESLTKLRTELTKYKAAVKDETAAGVEGQKQGTLMAGDTGKVYVRAAENTIEGTANTILEVADPSIQTDPHNWTRAKVGDWATDHLPPPRDGVREHLLPRVDLSIIKPDYNSDLFNRDVTTGKVDKDGITVGKLSETAVELSAPVIAGKVFAPATPLQTLGLPKTTVVQIQAERQAVSLLTQAQKSEPTITADLTNAVKQNTGELIGLENRLKSQESLTRKIADRTLKGASDLTKKGASRNQAIQKAMQTQVEGTNDALRYTVSLSKETYVENVNKTLLVLKKQGYKVEHTYDGWKLKGTANDPGYRGLNVTVKSPNGQVFELQFHTPESFANKTAGHVLYEEARNPLTSAGRREQIRQTQVKEAEKVPTPPEIEQLPSAKRLRKGVKTQ